MAEAAVEEVAEEGAGEKKPRNPIVLIIVGVVGLLVILASTVVGTLFITGFFNPKPVDPEIAEAAADGHGGCFLLCAQQLQGHHQQARDVGQLAGQSPQAVVDQLVQQLVVQVPQTADFVRVGLGRPAGQGLFAAVVAVADPGRFADGFLAFLPHVKP